MNAAVYVLIGLAVLIAIYLILREVNCWYWKINERITLQTETNQLLKNLLNQMSKSPYHNEDKDTSKSIKKNLYCQNCGKEQSNLTSTICEACGSKL